ncbi:putative reductive dehalogenase anchoring protein [Dehalococcoides mccartyi BTF08]|uniref:hypothetical protein n=1 Tax=Dehalococcoides mccartyi TaxID=61435 RepID=UPI0002B76498|nr:hypothetical protein [Dehalococcoides mccartyi]AGG08478.1 putative reductive dehalogenase anchoring protein [Dehalococcoides mccartyi BTF08]
MWFIVTFLIGATIVALTWWLRSRGVKVSWYEWLIGIIGLALLIFTAQNYFASLAEVESQAAYMFLLVTGLPSLVLLAIAWQLVVRKQKASA